MPSAQSQQPSPAAPAVPESGPGVRGPGMAKCSTRPARVASRDLVNTWCDRRSVSGRDLRALLDGASQNRIDEMRKGNAPYPLDVFWGLAPRDALDLLRAIEDSILAARVRTA